MSFDRSLICVCVCVMEGVVYLQEALILFLKINKTSQNKLIQKFQHTYLHKLKSKSASIKIEFYTLIIFFGKI